MTTTTHGAKPGAVTPKNDEPRRLVGSGAGFRGQVQAEDLDCANTTAQRKRFNTLRARLALAGWVLNSIAVEDGPVTYLASRWGMTRDLASLDAVAMFADRVGVR